MRHAIAGLLAIGVLGGCSDSAANSAAGIIGVQRVEASSLRGEYTAIDLGTLGGDLSVATGINNSGVVVGTSLDSDGRSAAFRWAGNTEMTRVADFGWCSGALAINDAASIVGWYRADQVQNRTDCGLRHSSVGSIPFKVSRDGTVAALNSYLVSEAAATSINELGDVVGWALFPNRGFVWLANGTTHRVGCGGDVVLSSISDDQVVFGSATGHPLAYWGGIRWTPTFVSPPGNHPECGAWQEDETYLTRFIHDANERGEHVGVGQARASDGTVGGGSVSYHFRPGLGFLPLFFIPNAISDRGHIVGSFGSQAVILTSMGELVNLGEGNALDVNNFGDVVGVSGAGRAVLWTTRAQTFPRGGRLRSTGGTQLQVIRSRENESGCPGKFAFLASMDAFPRCVRDQLAPTN